MVCILGKEFIVFLILLMYLVYCVLNMVNFKWDWFFWIWINGVGFGIVGLDLF